MTESPPDSPPSPTTDAKALEIEMAELRERMAALRERLRS